jgi:hypothetical protein
MSANMSIGIVEPRLLWVYRAVAACEPIEERDVWVAELRVANPRQFVMDLHRMELEWAEACRERGGSGEGEEGEGEGVVELGKERA